MTFSTRSPATLTSTPKLAPAKGLMFVFKALRTALESKEQGAIQSKVLGNALFVIEHHVMPESLELDHHSFFQRLSDSQRKKVAAQLDAMKQPNYEAERSLLKFVSDNWVEKRVFEKSSHDSRDPIRQKAPNSHAKPKSPAGSKISQPKAITPLKAVVIVKPLKKHLLIK